MTSEILAAPLFPSPSTPIPGSGEGSGISRGLSDMVELQSRHSAAEFSRTSSLSSLLQRGATRNPVPDVRFGAANHDNTHRPAILQRSDDGRNCRSSQVSVPYPDWT